MIVGVTVQAAINDFDGRTVQLTEERWGHTVERHLEGCGQIVTAFARRSMP
jgi:hypothetical protein